MEYRLDNVQLQITRIHASIFMIVNDDNHVETTPVMMKVYLKSPNVYKD